MKNVFLIIMLPFAVFSQQKYMLEGTLGKSPIYMAFDDYTSTEDDDKRIVDVRYFYRSQLKDIVLEGTRDGDKFEFFARRFSGDSIPEKFSLVKNGGTFTGIWQDSKGKKLPVSLKNFNPESLQKQFPKNPGADTPEKHTLDFARSRFLVFKLDSISKYKGKSIEWYGEKHCTAPMFRLGAGFLEADKKTLNPILEKMHYENALSQLGCSSGFDYSNGNGIEFSIGIDYLDENLLGFQIFRSWFCGGAHPDFGGEGILIDLHSGKRYEIDDIIAFDKSVTTEEKGGFDAFAAYRKTYFAPKIFALVDSEMHFKKPGGQDEDNCDYTELEYWDFISWSYTDKGITITPYFYRAARNCEDAFLIPFEKLKPYKNPAFPYTFDIKK